MTQRDKLIQKIQNLQAVSPQEVVTLMESLGWTTRQKGSHITLRKEDAEKITITTKNPAPIYILKQLIDRL